MSVAKPISKNRRGSNSRGRVEAGVTSRSPHRAGREQFAHPVPRFQLFQPSWKPIKRHPDGRIAGLPTHLWPAFVETVCRLGVLPVFPPDPALYPTSPSLQWVAWASLPHLLGQLVDTRYYARLRLPSAHLDALRSRSVTVTLLVPSVRVLSQSSFMLRNPCINARPAWSPGTPLPGCPQGNRWLSQVPRLPL